MKDKLEGQQLKTSKHERWIWRDNRGNYETMKKSL